MLRIFEKTATSRCDGVTRRNFMQVGALGLGEFVDEPLDNDFYVGRQGFPAGIACPDFTSGSDIRRLPAGRMGLSRHYCHYRPYSLGYCQSVGNPNGDPDENRPRRLPDGRFYVTDVRLKRFAQP